MGKQWPAGQLAPQALQAAPRGTQHRQSHLRDRRARLQEAREQSGLGDGWGLSSRPTALPRPGPEPAQRTSLSPGGPQQPVPSGATPTGPQGTKGGTPGVCGSSAGPGPRGGQAVPALACTQGWRQYPTGDSMGPWWPRETACQYEGEAQGHHCSTPCCAEGLPGLAGPPGPRVREEDAGDGSLDLDRVPGQSTAPHRKRRGPAANQHSILGSWGSGGSLSSEGGLGRPGGPSGGQIQKQRVLSPKEEVAESPGSPPTLPGVRPSHLADTWPKEKWPVGLSEATVAEPWLPASLGSRPLTGLPAAFPPCTLRVREAVVRATASDPSQVHICPAPPFFTFPRDRPPRCLAKR